MDIPPCFGFYCGYMGVTSHNKITMKNREKLEQLYDLLSKAEKSASEYSGGYSNHFFSAEEFHSALSESINKLKGGNTDEINILFGWFAPTCDWDDFISGDDNNIANEIFELLADLKTSLNIYSIFDLIIDYQTCVDKVMNAFKQEFKRTDLLTAWRSDKVFPQIGEFNKYGIKRYAFHGIGIHSTFIDNTTVDFDFAFLPEQRHDGFDLWRLSEFVSDQPKKYKKYLNQDLLKKDFEDLINNEIIVNPITKNSTSLYFFKGKLQKKGNKVIEKKWWEIWK